MTDTRQWKLSIVIPAYNEQGGLAQVLGPLAETIPDAEIIVVDDGSSDTTAEVAKACAARWTNIFVYRHRFNRGYGASLKSGMTKARGEYVAWFDADGEHKVADLVAMYEIIRTRPLAAVIAVRTSKSTTMFRGVGKWLIRLLALVLGLSGVSDLNCGLRIFRRGIIASYLSLLPDRYSASMTTTILMLERGYPVVYHPIQTEARVGQSKVKPADGFRALAKVLQLVTLFAPMRLFFRPGLAALIVGVVYGTFITITARLGFPTAAVLMTLGGMLLCILGLIADQISQFRLELRRSDDVIIDERDHAS